MVGRGWSGIEESCRRDLPRGCGGVVGRVGLGLGLSASSVIESS